MQNIKVAWFGQITNFQQIDNRWKVDVDYYSDANPDRRIPKTLNFPITATKPDVVAGIKDMGAQVIAISSLNTQNIIGNVIPVP